MGQWKGRSWPAPAPATWQDGVGLLPQRGGRLHFSGPYPQPPRLKTFMALVRLPFWEEDWVRLQLHVKPAFLAPSRLPNPLRRCTGLFSPELQSSAVLAALLPGEGSAPPRRTCPGSRLVGPTSYLEGVGHRAALQRLAVPG